MNRAVEELSLANDFIFGEVMRQPENVKPLLEAVLEKKIAEITYIEKQQDIKDGFELHGIRLDISLEDNEKTQYAVEMQTGSAYDLERRIRYYQSSLDRRTLEVSERYRDLRDSYEIFVCTEDYYKRGLVLYKRKSVIEGAEDIFYEDGSHAYVLNANFTVPNMGRPALEFLSYINAAISTRNTVNCLLIFRTQTT
jgi:predicted transposase/invertase (TIGR01784 family)